MNMGRARLFLAVIFALAANSVAHAASVTYLMDQSNVLPNGVNYLEVTIDDTSGAPGDINFTVTPLSSLTAIAGSNYGIQEFAFNGAGLTAANIVNLPSGWKAGNPGNNFASFGTFDNVVSGTGDNRAYPLKFSITGISGDTIASYASGNPYFVAHLAGFALPGANCVSASAEEDFTSALPPIHNSGSSNDGGDGEDGGGDCTSGFFAGSTQKVPPSAVPLPSAVWLFASGMIGVLVVARRRNGLVRRV